MTDITYRAGFAGILGWTNVGKSTLVNLLTGMKIAITADCPQTTRHRLVGIVQGDDYQIAFTDTPGIHNPRNELSRHMIKTTWGTMVQMDLILWMVFPDRPVVKQLQIFQSHLEQPGVPLVIAINKIDTVSKESLIPLIDEFYKAINPVAIVPISARTGLNTDRLLDVIVENLPVSEPIFPIDQVTDQPERVIASEYIREQVIAHTFQELPHVVAVDIELFRYNDRGTLEIIATIYVEKQSQKGIIIGAGGEMIKKIGSVSRQMISTFLDCRVDLRLWIKVNPGWRSDPDRMRRLGFQI
ncbi:GTPase Era [bacterium]|nr:GTPase Era [candidate division CSSED10-310 bacterium]